jgi:hypothetical protein
LGKEIERKKCNDTEQQKLFANVRENKLLILYCEMKLEWRKEEYTVYCMRKERNVLAWLKTGIWELRTMRTGLEKGRCPLCREDEDVYTFCLIIGNEEVE